MKVQSVGPQKTIQGKYGELVIYQLQFEGDSDWVELSQKPTTPAPTVGQELEGNIETTQYGKRFKKAQNASGGFSRGGESNRQVALKVAAQVFASPNNKDRTMEDLANDFLKWLDGGASVSASVSSPSSEQQPPTDEVPLSAYDEL